jgi:hypothetical protein
MLKQRKNDISIIRLDKAVTRVNPIPLPSATLAEMVGKPAITFRFGASNAFTGPVAQSDKVTKSALTVVANKNCQLDDPQYMCATSADETSCQVNGIARAIYGSFW